MKKTSSKKSRDTVPLTADWAKNAATFNITFQVSIPRGGGGRGVEQKQISSDTANLTANYQYTHVNGSVPSLAKQFAVRSSSTQKTFKAG